MTPATRFMREAVPWHYMANEAFVRLLCPECNKNWERSASDLPGHDANFSCPNCHASRLAAEFARTGRDLETMKAL